jgi:protein-S-isoprenylcysteine O-methyltransferase Ste14
MNSESTFRFIVFALALVFACVRVYYGHKAPQTVQRSKAARKEALEREGWWSVLLRISLFVLMLGFLIIYVINPPWLGALFSMSLPAWTRWVGAGLAVVSISLLAWVHHTLGKHWSTGLALREEHTLVTDGPYRWIRHPMYTALFAFFVGGALVSSNWIVTMLAVIAIAVLYGRIGREEAMMIEQFGDQYQAYKRRTGRLLPRFGRR